MACQDTKEQQLWLACTEGNLELVRSLCEDPAVDVNWADEEYHRTPLYRASGHGQTDVVRLLLHLDRMDVNNSNQEGGTPLFIACQEGHAAIISLLINDPRVDVNATSHDGVTPFHMSCFGGHLPVVRLLLGDPRIIVTLADIHGKTPFYMSCEKGHESVAALLMADPRVDVSRPNMNEATPFYIACEKGHRDVISLLLSDPRIDVNLPAKKATPFYISCQEGHKEAVATLLDDPRVSVNQPRDDNSTPLWFASQNGHLDVAQHLLASDREVHVWVRSDFNQKTAAEQARQQPDVKRGDHETEDRARKRQTNGPAIANLIDSYEIDPVAVKARLRKTPGIREHFIGQAFALVVFHVDSFVALRAEAPSTTRRFFNICGQLPMELQMVLCNRMFGSPRDVVPSRLSEPAFKWLVRLPEWQ